MLDRLTPLQRHLAIAAIAVLLAFLGQEIVPLLAGKPGWAGVVGSLLTIALTYFTPLVKQYGTGNDEPPFPTEGDRG